MKKADRSKCHRCCRPAYMGRRRRPALCVIHHRHRCMRNLSQQRGIGIPSHEKLEALTTAVLADGMRCPVCREEMQWLRAGGRLPVLTLQHDHDGGFRLICQPCNKRHASYPNDSFYQLQPDEKRCNVCGEIKKFTEFNKNKRGWKGFQRYCRKCEVIINARRSKKCASS